MSEQTQSDKEAEKRKNAPWIPMSVPIDIKHLGKLGEEICETGKVLFRALIQGIDEQEPDSPLTNKERLEDEIGDVLANIELVIGHFNLDLKKIQARKEKKKALLKPWHNAL